MSVEQIGKQTQTTYEQYKKIKTLVDVGFFLIDYVVMGGETTKDITHNNKVNVAEIVVSLDNDVMRHEAVSFITKTPNTTYFLDYRSDGSYHFDTAHSSGLYLPIAEVTTDANGNISVITDKRGEIGGFRLQPGYEYPELNQVVTEVQDARKGIDSVARPTLGQYVREIEKISLTQSYNWLINGNFDVWQRGTNFNISSTVSTYTADRWIAFAGGGSPSITVSRESFTPGQNEVPNEPTHYLRINQTVAGSSDNSQINQRIEDVRTFAGKKVTVSFWARSNTPFNIDVSMVQRFGSGGSSDVGSNLAVLNVTTVWKKFIVTVSVPPITGKTIGANSYIMLRLRLPAHPWTGRFDISQVQLCEGDIALPFQPRSYAEELALCRRYCVVVENVNNQQPISFGYCDGPTRIQVALFYPNVMRITPTVTLSPATYYEVRIGTISIPATNLVISAQHLNAVVINVDVASGFTAGQVGLLRANTATGVGGKIIIDAEL